jgi:hypothetical protein
MQIIKCRSINKLKYNKITLITILCILRKRSRSQWPCRLRKYDLRPLDSAFEIRLRHKCRLCPPSGRYRPCDGPLFHMSWHMWRVFRIFKRIRKEDLTLSFRINNAQQICLTLHLWVPCSVYIPFIPVGWEHKVTLGPRLFLIYFSSPSDFLSSWFAHQNRPAITSRDI